MTTLSLIAPAKINLFLHITGKRTDGYHLVESLVAFCEFGDEITFETCGPLSLAIEGEYAPLLIEDTHHNLVMRAATELRFRSGCNEGAKIQLTKNIPIAAGLGGGSSDAGATIEGLCKLWKIYGIDDIKKNIAIVLGADVPMCIKPQTSFVQGIGEKTSPVSMDFDLYAVLVNPNIPLLTKDVFRAFDQGYAQSTPCPQSFKNLDTLISFLAQKNNSLAAPAQKLVPDIEQMQQALSATLGCKLTRMTGSGATCFGLYAEEGHAQAACEEIKATFPNWWAIATKLKRYG